MKGNLSCYWRFPLAEYIAGLAENGFIVEKCNFLENLEEARKQGCGHRRVRTPVFG
jgi:hypothetical protein